MKCAVVILNWNGLDDTVECIDSILNYNSDLIDIFLVDNGSETNDLEKLKARYGEEISEYIQNDSNLGFSGGNNVAIDAAISMNYQYVCTLNNDTVVTENWIEDILLTLDLDPSLGSAGGKLMIYGQVNILNSTGIIPMPQGAGIDRGRFTRMMAVLMICLMFLGSPRDTVFTGQRRSEKLVFLMRIFSRTMKMWT